MPTVLGHSKELLDTYDGYNKTEVGLGLQTGMYATPQYAKKKIQNLVIGGLSKVKYIAYDIDTSPTIFVMKLEPQYNTVLGLNIRYVPEQIRRAIMKYILDSNVARIESKQPIIIDYNAIKRAIPQIQGIVRRYKVFGLRVEETVPLVEWPNVAKENSPFQNVYRQVNS